MTRPSPTTILIVGKPFSGLTNYMLDHKYRYVSLQDSRLPKVSTAGAEAVVDCDFSDRPKLLDAADRIAKKYHPDGVMAVYEQYVLPAAEIASHLRLPGLPIDAAIACTDKFVMRQKFAASPHDISPHFALVKSETDIQTFAHNHSFPLILKPANLSKSLLVTKNDNYEQLLENYERTVTNIEAVYATYAPSAVPKLLVEEFLEGSVHSVDAFVDARGTAHVLPQVVDYQTGHDIGYDDNFHYSRLLPSTLSKRDAEAIRQVAAWGCEALGMKSTPAHVEIILTANGPRIVEIGARNGGYRERMHRLANNFDVIGNAIKLALGQPPVIAMHSDYPVGVFELFPKTPGIFTEVKNEAELKALPSLSYYSRKVKPGDFAGKSSDGFKMCAVIILHHKDPSQFRRDVDYMNNHVRVITRPA